MTQPDSNGPLATFHPNVQGWSGVSAEPPGISPFPDQEEWILQDCKDSTAVTEEPLDKLDFTYQKVISLLPALLIHVSLLRQLALKYTKSTTLAHFYTSEE